MTKNTKTPHPGGVEEIQTTTPEEDAAGAFLSPPASLPGGRADDESPLGRLRYARAGVSVTGEALGALVDAAVALPSSVQRRLGPSLTVAREAAARLEHMAVVLDAEIVSVGGQESPDREAETPDGAEVGGQDAVETGAEISADVVVRNEQGEEVDR